MKTISDKLDKFFETPYIVLRLGTAVVRVYADGKITNLRNRSMGNGDASRLMGVVCAALDRRSLSGYLWAKPSADSPMTLERLVQYYRGFGFVENSKDIEGKKILMTRPCKNLK